VTDSAPADGEWRKSQASNVTGGECVEVSLDEHAVQVRHSHRPTGPVLSFSQAEWNAFLIGVRNGEFDLPDS
jgi:Domain of unknown function (DUF397)